MHYVLKHASGFSCLCYVCSCACVHTCLFSLLWFGPFAQLGKQIAPSLDGGVECSNRGNKSAHHVTHYGTVAIYRAFKNLTNPLRAFCIILADILLQIFGEPLVSAFYLTVQKCAKLVASNLDLSNLKSKSFSFCLFPTFLKVHYFP